MDWIQVEGENRGDVTLYALSTCGWCKKTKRFLDDLGVAYRYKDVDMAFGSEREELLDAVRNWNPLCSFPTIVVNDQCIIGFKPEKIKEALGS
ncbi:MAG: glutaredoxin family protein [Anaerolineales bacterium]|nr:MAG: glutaredoxin family protein [Anaerolineales bacterium]